MSEQLHHVYLVNYPLQVLIIKLHLFNNLYSHLHHQQNIIIRVGVKTTHVIIKSNFDHNLDRMQTNYLKYHLRSQNKNEYTEFDQLEKQSNHRIFLSVWLLGEFRQSTVHLQSFSSHLTDKGMCIGPTCRPQH